MATNEKKVPAEKAISEPSAKTPVKTSKSNDQDLAAVAANAAGVVGDVYASVSAEEAAKEDALDRMAAEALEEHLERLKEKSITEEQRDKSE